jgi:hypothetical protein
MTSFRADSIFVGSRRMSTPPLRRRTCLLLPLLLAACGGEPRLYPPLRYDYLPPIRLNVAQVEVQQDFLPSGVAPDVTPLDPVQPVDVLRQMAVDRLKPFGPAGRAVFVIQNASLVQDDDTITGTLAVRLDVYTSANVRAGYAEARVSRQHIGHIDDMRQTLYDMTRQMMDGMNVELEYQIKRSLSDWLVAGTAPAPTVQQQPLTAPGAPPPPGTPPSPPPGTGSPLPPPVPLHAP